MSDPKETPTPATTEAASASVEEQTANPFAVEDEQDIEDIDLELDEGAEGDGEETEAAEGEEDEDAEGDEEYEGDLEFDEDGNPVEDAC